MHRRSQLDTEIFNDGTKDGDVLNSGCGADFVKVNLFIQKNLDIETYGNIQSIILLKYFLIWIFFICLIGTTKMPAQFGKRGRWC